MPGSMLSVFWLVDCRYAGRAYETAEQVADGQGTLMIKGLKSAWRQAAPIVRTTLHGALTRILMQVSLLSLKLSSR